MCNKIGSVVSPSVKTKASMVGRILEVKDCDPFTGSKEEGSFALVTWFHMGKPQRTWWPTQWLTAK